VNEEKEFENKHTLRNFALVTLTIFLVYSMFFGFFPYYHNSNIISCSEIPSNREAKFLSIEGTMDSQHQGCEYADAVIIGDLFCPIKTEGFESNCGTIYAITKQGERYFFGE